VGNEWMRAEFGRLLRRGLRYAPELAMDVARITAHLQSTQVPDMEARWVEIFDAFDILSRHPLIGRQVASGHRELVIGKGARGYLALYTYDALEDGAYVLALRAQREGKFVPR
jgi:plasmid stabilization system protein ParE